MAQEMFIKTKRECGVCVHWKGPRRIEDVRAFYSPADQGKCMCPTSKEHRGNRVRASFICPKFSRVPCGPPRTK